MGKVTEYLTTQIRKQVENSGIVVWYDADKIYTNLVNDLTIPETTVLRFEDSFFKLRNEIEPFIEFIKDGKPRHDCSVQPKVIVYVPKSRHETHYALIEAETAGVVMEPGAHPWQRNTRLRVIAEQVFKKIQPDSVNDICRQIEEGKLNLEELDRLSTEMEGVATGTIKIIFGTASGVEVALAFAATTQHDEAILSKQAMPELSGLFQTEIGVEVMTDADPEPARKILWRTILLTDFLAGLPEDKRPDAFSSLPLPKRKEHIERICQLCKIWRNRGDLREVYIEAAKKVEKELAIAAIDLPADLLKDLETFPFIENKLLLFAEQSILNGRPDMALYLAERRKHSFWSFQEPLFQLRWTLLENSAQILIIGEQIRKDLNKGKISPEEMIRNYTEGDPPWYVVDKCYRHLERQYSSFDLDLSGEHDELEEVIAFVRKDYTRTIEQSIEFLTSGLEATDFQIKGCLPQNNIYPRYVLPALKENEKIAYILVDALRYEIGKELIDGLKEDFEGELLAGLAQVPTLTTVGMAALMPASEKGLELAEASGSKLAIKLGSVLLKDRASRLKYFCDSLNKNVALCKLNELIKPSKKRQAEIKGADIVLVTSQEIDRLGEEAEGEDEVRLFMEEMIDKLRRGIRRLASLGVEHIVVTADHGHLFGETIESGMKMDPPGGKTLELHRRVWIGKGGKSGEGFLRVSAGQLGLKGDLEFAFPRTLACFKTKGGTSAYFHGGISLQEMVLPVTRLKAKKIKAYAPEMAGVKLTMEKPKITTRFFSVTATYYMQGLLGSDEIRVRMIVRADRKDVAFAAMAAYGYEEGTKEIILQKDKPNAITFMLTDTENVNNVSVHVIDAISEVELARLEHIPVQLSI